MALPEFMDSNFFLNLQKQMATTIAENSTGFNFQTYTFPHLSEKVLEDVDMVEFGKRIVDLYDATNPQYRSGNYRIDILIQNVINAIEDSNGEELSFSNGCCSKSTCPIGIIYGIIVEEFRKMKT